MLLCSSLFFNLGVLGFFKYYNFFIDSWINLLSTIGYNIESVWTLNIILPVGISFYTFQTMSYTIDIYRKRLQPTRDFISFASFVSFFPQLVAGPIERASNLLPQILKKRELDFIQVSQGLRLILWGMFKKVVIADSLAPIVDDIFFNYQNLSGGTLWLGAIYFAFQIYCDFSGYSDIAIGSAKLFGFELISNFKFPYFSRNIGEFWRRWHISLSSWFRDYLYIPLGGSKKGKWKSIRNIFTIFLVSGLWHGANWTFIFWGLFHSILFLPSFFFQTNRKFKDSIIANNKLLPSSIEIFQVLSTFLLVSVGWVFFRSETIGGAVSYIDSMFIDLTISQRPPNEIIFNLIFLLFIEFTQRKSERNLFYNFHKVIFRIFVILCLFLILINLGSEPQQFIYFDF